MCIFESRVSFWGKCRVGYFLIAPSCWSRHANWRAWPFLTVLILMMPPVPVLSVSSALGHSVTAVVLPFTVDLLDLILKAIVPQPWELSHDPYSQGIQGLREVVCGPINAQTLSLGPHGFKFSDVS